MEADLKKTSKQNEKQPKKKWKMTSGTIKKINLYWL
jgi:hypothetical protein